MLSSIKYTSPEKGLSLCTLLRKRNTWQSFCTDLFHFHTLNVIIVPRFRNKGDLILRWRTNTIKNSKIQLSRCIIEYNIVFHKLFSVNR